MGNTMFDRLLTFWQSFEWSWMELAGGVLLGVVFFLISTGVAIFLVVKLPADYFRDPAVADCVTRRHPLLRSALWVGKNLLGVTIVGVGVILTLPGVPGPGLLVILFGVLLLEFPGKRGLEQKLVRHPRVLNSINRLRARFHRQPLDLQ